MTKAFNRKENVDAATAAAYVGSIEGTDVRPETRVNLVGSWFTNIFEHHIDRLVQLRVYELRCSTFL